MDTPKSLETLIGQTVNSVTQVSGSTMEAFLDLVVFEKVAPGISFVKRGQLNEHEYFILEGLCHSFVHNADNEPVSLAFYNGPSVLIPHTARTLNDKASMSVSSLSEILLAKVKADVFLQLMIANIEIREFANQVLRNELIRKTQREVDMASLTALQRLQKFREEHPFVENQVSAPTLASYLGITSISLSRLRGQLARGK